MNISSENLFHFTDSFDKLKSILTSEGFYPSFCLETHINLSSNLEIYYPMICFCDIPLSKISIHIQNYGKYGIALKRIWGIEAKLNPVLYPIENSPLSNLIANGLLSASKDQGAASIIKPLITLSKTRIGKMYRHSKKGYIEDVNFYNEREWRYVPYNFEPWMAFKSQDFDYNIIEEYNKKLKSHKLDFKNKDVAYIIVSNSNEVKEISELTNGISVLAWDEIKDDI